MTIAPLPFSGESRALVQALRDGHPGAAAAFYDRYAELAHRTLERTLGPDADLPDLLQDVFITAIDKIDRLDDPDRAPQWLTSIAVFTARACIRRRQRRKWLSLLFHDREAVVQPPPATGARQALHEVYDVLETFPVDERLAFSLRIIDSLPLREAAEAAGVSLATFKRKLTRAERRFLSAVAARPILKDWLQEGNRWNETKQA